MPPIIQPSIHLAERRHLRKNQTKGEQVLWYELRNSCIGYKFRRQVSIGPFIVDFYCDGARLAIELDGPIHEEQKEYDMRRQMYLEQQGIRVVRFTNDHVLFKREEVMAKILRICTDLAPADVDLTPRPSPAAVAGQEREVI